MRSVHAIKPIAYDDCGVLKRNEIVWVPGKEARPLEIIKAPLMASVGIDGLRRFNPTREDDRWIEIGAPMIKQALTWEKMALGMMTASSATPQDVKWQATNYLTNVVHAGHYVKQTMELLNGWLPGDNQLSYPIMLNGLDFRDGVVSRDGVPVAHLRDPYVYDAASIEIDQDHRPVSWEIVELDKTVSLVYTLPDLRGMVRPVIDPTLVLQPDAAGKDADSSSYTGNGDERTKNYGAANILCWGWYSNLIQHRSFIQFDLSAIPTGAIVSTSNLALVRVVDYGYQAYTYGAYAILHAWVEGTKNGTAPADGVTWLTYDGTNTWGTAGCDNTTTDRNAIGENLHTINYAGNNTWSIPVMTQAWVSTPVSNLGLLMATTDTWVAQGQYGAASSDHATAADRPQLTVEYTVAQGRALHGLLNRSIL